MKEQSVALELVSIWRFHFTLVPARLAGFLDIQASLLIRLSLVIAEDATSIGH